MSHHHGGHEHDHDHGPAVDTNDHMSMQTLYTKVDKDQVRCLNEREAGSAKAILRPWADRLEITPVYNSASCWRVKHLHKRF